MSSKNRKSNFRARFRRKLPFLIIAQNGLCMRCGLQLGSDLSSISCDHAMPLGLGGEDVFKNIGASHRACDVAHASKALTEVQSTRLIAAHKIFSQMTKKYEDHLLQKRNKGRNQL